MMIFLLAGFQLRAEVSLENANWELFTNRDSIRAFALSKDKATPTVDLKDVML